MAHVGGLFEKARGLEGQAAKLSTRSTTLPDIIKAALTKKLTSGPLIKQRETALQNFLDVGTQPVRAQQVLPDATKDIFFDPNTVTRLRQQRRNAAFVPLSSANLQLGASFGGIATATDAATRAFQAQVEAAQNQAILARQSAVDAQTLESAELARQVANKPGPSPSTVTTPQVDFKQDLREGLQAWLKGELQGVNFLTIVSTYAPNLSLATITSIYNQTAGRPISQGGFGPPKESASQIQQAFLRGKQGVSSGPVRR